MINDYEINIICINKNSIIPQLKSRSYLDDYHISLGVGGLVNNAETRKEGFQISNPVLNIPLKTLVLKQDNRHFWTFLAPISIEVALIYIAISFIIGTLIWIF